MIQFAPAAKGAAPNKGDELDSAGRSILGLLHKAAGVAEANSQHALELAQKLSQELRAAEDRIAQLETDVRYYQERTDRAEQWLHKIFTEIRSDFSGSSKISAGARLTDVAAAELKSRPDER